jgi:hypothetical protein
LAPIRNMEDMLGAINHLRHIHKVQWELFWLKPLIEILLRCWIVKNHNILLDADGQNNWEPNDATVTFCGTTESILLRPTWTLHHMWAFSRWSQNCEISQICR